MKNPKKKTTLKDNAPKRIHQSHSLLDRLGGTSLTLAGNRFVTSLFIVLFAILSFLYFPSWGGGDYDMWWHFALGKYYLSHQYDESKSCALLLDTCRSQLALQHLAGKHHCIPFLRRGRGIWALVVSMGHIRRYLSLFPVFCASHPGQVGHQRNFSPVHDRHCRRACARISQTGSLHPPLFFRPRLLCSFQSNATNYPLAIFICTRPCLFSG